MLRCSSKHEIFVVQASSLLQIYLENAGWKPAPQGSLHHKIKML